MNLKSRLEQLERSVSGGVEFCSPGDPSAIPVVVLPNGDYELFGMRFAAGTPVQWAGRYYRIYGPGVSHAFFWDDEGRVDGRSIQQRWRAAVQRMEATGARYELA